MAIYRISILPGKNPAVEEKTTLGFFQGANKEAAIENYLKMSGVNTPRNRVIAETKFQVGQQIWEIELNKRII
jgi:hypothetical protein